MKDRWWCGGRQLEADSEEIILKVRPHLPANTNEAGRGEAYSNICLDYNMMQNVVVRRASEWFSLKYQLQADNVRSASDQTEAVFLSLVTRLHCCACLVSACLARIFVLMWTRLKKLEKLAKFGGGLSTCSYKLAISCWLFHIMLTVHCHRGNPRQGKSESVDGNTRLTLDPLL